MSESVLPNKSIRAGSFDAQDMTNEMNEFLEMLALPPIVDPEEYEGMQVEQARRLKELEKENTRLKRWVAA